MGKVAATIGWTGRDKEYRPLTSMGVQRALLPISAILLKVLAICIFPVFCRFREGSVIMGADELQCLLVFGIFVAGMVEKQFKNLVAAIFLAIYAGGVAFGQATFLHNEIIKEAGLDHIWVADLRHTCAVLSLQNGMDTKGASQMLGHFRTAMIRQNYVPYLVCPAAKYENKPTEASQERLRQAADILDNLLKF